MVTSIREVMTPDPLTVDAGAPIVDAARMMRDAKVGTVVVMKNGGEICGIATDRDLVVKGIAEKSNASEIRMDDVCSHSLLTVNPDDPSDRAVSLMRDHALRRLAVTEDDRLVGIVSLGDLAVERDRKSVLGEISDAPPNN